MGENLNADILGDSICKTCTYRMSRIISPFNFDYYEFSDEELEEIERLQDDSDADVLLEEHVCMALRGMLDCQVLECNYYRNKQTETSLIYDDDIFKCWQI